MASPDLNETLQALGQLASSPPQDPDVRKKLYDAANKLSVSVESQHDAVFRTLYSPMILTISQLAQEMKIFDILVTKGRSSVSDLAAPSGADVVLTARIARYLASQGIIAEVAESVYDANNLTHTLSVAGFAGGMEHSFYFILPCLQAAPAFLKNTGYINPEDSTNTPFHIAHNTKLPTFEWAKTQPDLVRAASLWMGVVHEKNLNWLTVCNFEDFTKGATPETPVFVDMGGGLGFQCALVRSIDNLVGRVILQELPEVLVHAFSTPGVENTIHDFWGEQPVKGARAYYMRNILHDFPDDKCKTILKNTVAAMGPDSVILIDEIITPNQHAQRRSTVLDIAMMVTLAASERTQSQWDKLLRESGLKALHSATYNHNNGESLQIVRPI